MGSAAGIAVLAVGGFVVFQVSRGAETERDGPDVGECMTANVLLNEVEVVDCASAEASFRVIGDAGSWSSTDFSAATEGELCHAFPDYETALWVSHVNSDPGRVVCVVSVTP